MDVKEAVEIAKAYVTELFKDEGLTNLGLEEVEREQSGDRWLITVAFSRPWNAPRTRASEMLAALGSAAPALKRSYKVVAIGRDGDVVSMKDRVSADVS